MFSAEHCKTADRYLVIRDAVCPTSWSHTDISGKAQKLQNGAVFIAGFLHRPVLSWITRTHIKHMNKPTVRAPDITIVSRRIGFRAYPYKLCANAFPQRPFSRPSILQTSKSRPSTVHHPILANSKRFSGLVNHAPLHISS